MNDPNTISADIYGQLLLFPETREEKLQREVTELRICLEKVRKSQFAKIGAVKKDCDYLKHELETLKSALCRSEKTYMQQAIFI